MNQLKLNYSLKEIELKLIEIWVDIFNTRNINVDSDFFELGGNSLTAVKFLNRTEQIFGVDALLPDALFSNGVLKNLALEINNYIKCTQSVI